MHCIASTLKPSNLDGLENFKGHILPSMELQKLCITKFGIVWLVGWIVFLFFFSWVALGCLVVRVTRFIYYWQSYELYWVFNWLQLLSWVKIFGKNLEEPCVNCQKLMRRVLPF